jgi:hypothetical protein
MLEPNNAQAVHIINTHTKLISPILTKYQAGSIATSEGNGKKLDSNVIMINIPTYHISQTIEAMYSIILLSNIVKQNKH